MKRPFDVPSKISDLQGWIRTWLGSTGDPSLSPSNRSLTKRGRSTTAYFARRRSNLFPGQRLRLLSRGAQQFRMIALHTFGLHLHL
jgi:hypothetical protein